MAKTTIDIADNLFIKAKKMAAELGRPLRAIVEAALRSYLADILVKKPTGKREVKIRWKTVDAGIPSKLDISNRTRMHSWLKNTK